MLGRRITKLLLVALGSRPAVAASHKLRLSAMPAAAQALGDYEDATTRSQAPSFQTEAKALSDRQTNSLSSRRGDSEEFRSKLNRLAMIMSNTGVLLQENEHLREVASQGAATGADEASFLGGMPLDKVIVLGSTLLTVFCTGMSILVMRHYDAVAEAEEENDSRLHFPFGAKARFVCGGWISSELARGLLTVLMAGSVGFCFLWWAEIIQPFLKDLVVYVYLGLLVMMLVYIFGAMLMKEMGMMSFVLTSLMKGIHEMQDMVNVFEEQVATATGGCASRKRPAATPGTDGKPPSPATEAGTPRKTRGAGCL